MRYLLSEKVVSALRTEGRKSDKDSERRMGRCLGQKNLELRLERDEGFSHAQIWKTTSDRENSQYKGPKLGPCREAKSISLPSLFRGHSRDFRSVL